MPERSTNSSPPESLSERLVALAFPASGGMGKAKKAALELI